nr:RhuM family protein [Prevotella intermedia]
MSVGYRVKSKRGVQFCQWANRVLKQYLIKCKVSIDTLHFFFS